MRYLGLGVFIYARCHYRAHTYGFGRPFYICGRRIVILVGLFTVVAGKPAYRIFNAQNCRPLYGCGWAGGKPACHS